MLIKLSEVDSYIERQEQYQADRKMRELESEYMRSGYWPETHKENQCVTTE